MNKQKCSFRDTDIAIIGMSARMPDAENIDQFWNHLLQGRECIHHIKEEESGYVNSQGLMKDAEYFDHGFFDIKDSDALHMDPQYRCLLECAYHTLEDAGYANEDKDRSIGVFVGADETFYVWNDIFGRLSRNQSVDRIGMFLENTLASQISYKLNLTGPSFALKAACATSMVAVHVAIESLLNYDCNMALAGGVNIKWLESGYQVVNGMSSPQGQLRAYDALADGFVPGNGVGLIALKRLDEAMEARDQIYAIIRGSSVVNDGKRKAGYHASSVEGEAEAIYRAMANAECLPQDILAIEGHGTATPLGDSVEIRAIDQAYKRLSSEDYHCALGSVKANIGHLNTAAGIAGIMKAVLSLKHGVFPPSVNFDEPNPELQKHPGLFVTKQPYVYPKDRLRVLGVSSFGFGGVNAHMILEEAPAQEDLPQVEKYYVLPLSGKSKKSLRQNCLNLEEYLKNHPENIAATAYVLDYCRSHYQERAFYLCNQQGELLYSSLSTEEVEFKDAELEKAYLFGKKWLEENSYLHQEFHHIPYKVSLPGYAFDKTKFFIPQLDLKHRKKPLGIMDGLSSSRYELTKYLARQKTNLLKVYVKDEKPNHFSWIDPKTMWHELEKREEELIGEGDFYFLHQHPKAKEKVDGFCRLCLGEFWRESGAFDQEKTRSLDEMQQELLANDDDQAFFHFLLKTSEDYGLLELSSSFVCSLVEFSDFDQEKIQQELKSFKEKLPQGYALMKLLSYCTEHYLEVFRGERTGSQILYPKGSYELLQSIQSKGTAEEVYCKLAAELIYRLYPEGESKLRILEIGGGTGELTDEILALLGHKNIQYSFTDIGNAFLSSYKKKLPDELKKKLNFLKVDITQALEGQKIPKHSVDLIVGVNVVQATADIKGSMQNLLEALRPGGYMVMVQLYRLHPLQEMIFGLSPGWWNYSSDPYGRKEPYFNHASWIDFWKECGLQEVNTLPSSSKVDRSNAMVLLGKKEEGELDYVDHEVEERKKELLEIDPATEFYTIQDFSQEEIEKIRLSLQEKNPLAELIGFDEKTISGDEQSIEVQVKSMVKEILNVDQLHDQVIDEFDSLSLLLLLAEIEKRFSYAMKLEQIYSMSTLEELIEEIKTNSGVKEKETKKKVKEEGDLSLLFEELEIKL